MIDKLVYINQMLNENLHYMYSINGVKFYEITSNDLEAFREEMEVLKIIVNKKVEFRLMGNCLQVRGEHNKNWTFIKEFDLSKEKEEYNKLKQWLEENDE